MYATNLANLAQQALVTRLQATANSSVLHQQCLLQFQNTPRGQEALNMCVDAAQIIYNAQCQMGVTEQQAAEKAANHVHRGYLAVTLNEFPQLRSQLDYSVLNEIPAAMQTFNNLQLDIQRVKTGMVQQPVMGQYQQPVMPQYQQPQQMGYGSTGIPPIAAGGLVGNQPMQYQQPAPAFNVSNFAVQQPAQPTYVAPQGYATIPETPGFCPEAYPNDIRPNTDIINNVAPLNFNVSTPQNTQAVPLTPVESWGSSVPTPSPTQPVKVAKMANNSVEHNYNPNKADWLGCDPRYTHHPRMNELPIPLCDDDILVDPYNYIPEGVVLDRDRPWDRFYAPGGIIIERADKTNFKLTKGDDAPYKLLYNPLKLARFFAKWPDGKVSEVFATYSENPEMKMDYLKHELNANLKEQEALLRKGRLNEVTVANMSSGSVAPLDAVAEVIKENEVTVLDNITPVAIDNVIYDVSEVEAERIAVEMIREQIGEAVDAVPAHRYFTNNRTKVIISDDVAEELQKLTKVEDLRLIAKKLKDLVNSGEISVRTMQFFNSRLTKEINEVSKVGLSIEDYDIGDFVRYIDDYLEYFGGINKGYVPVMNSAINQIAGRAFNLIKVEDQWMVQDERINIQLSVDSLEIGNMLPGDEAARLSLLVHPAIVELVKGALTNNVENDKRDIVRIRLITQDGAYIDIARGRLKAGSMVAYRVA